ARVHRAILQRLQRLATRDLREQAIRQEVFDAVDELSQNWQRIIAARQEAILAGRTYEAEQRQFDVGARTSTDVLDAASRLAEAQTREIVALTDYQITQVDIAFATGTLLGYGRVQWDPIDLPRGDRDVRRYDRVQSADRYDEALDADLPPLRQHADEHRPPVRR
ncbi:MAG: TolC family protein, partial [Phycisphaerae bacterium]|nr:TolC family protein [Phycisphaerae bacterium]